MTPELISKRSKLKMILHNWPINMFIFAFNFLEKKRVRRRIRALRARLTPRYPGRPGSGLSGLRAPAPQPGAPACAAPAAQQRARGPSFRARGPRSRPVRSPLVPFSRPFFSALSGERVAPWPRRPLGPPGRAPPRDAGFLYAGGELGALERTRVLHPFRGAENPPSGLQRGARPRQEEAGARRTF